MGKDENGKDPKSKTKGADGVKKKHGIPSPPASPVASPPPPGTPLGGLPPPLDGNGVVNGGNGGDGAGAAVNQGLPHGGLGVAGNQAVPVSGGNPAFFAFTPGAPGLVPVALAGGGGMAGNVQVPVSGGNPPLAAPGQQAQGGGGGGGVFGAGGGAIGYGISGAQGPALLAYPQLHLAAGNSQHSAPKCQGTCSSFYGIVNERARAQALMDELSESNALAADYKHRLQSANKDLALQKDINTKERGMSSRAIQAEVSARANSDASYKAELKAKDEVIAALKAQLKGVEGTSAVTVGALQAALASVTQANSTLQSEVDHLQRRLGGVLNKKTPPAKGN